MLNASLSHRIISIVPAALRRLLHLCCLPFCPCTKIFFIIAFFPLSFLVAELFSNNLDGGLTLVDLFFFIFYFCLRARIRIRFGFDCESADVHVDLSRFTHEVSHWWVIAKQKSAKKAICYYYSDVQWWCDFFVSYFFLYSDTDVWSLYLSKHKFVGTNAYFQLCLSSTRFSLPFCNFSRPFSYILQFAFSLLLLLPLQQQFTQIQTTQIE